MFGMTKKDGNVGLTRGDVEKCGEEERRKQRSRERG